MKDSNNKKVTVIIPCRNEEKYIAECLQAVVNQSYGIENIEVLVVDGCSEDRTREIIKEFSDKYPQIKLINNEKKIAPTAMNLGLKNSTGDIIIRIDGHAYMDVEYVKTCIEKLKTSGAACVGGRIINISENEAAEAISLAMGSPFGVGNALFRYSDKEVFVDTLAFGAYKKEVFDKIGYFDEELVRNQDDELNYRLTKSGEKILLSPDIISHYYTRGSFRKLWRQYFQYGFWKVRVIQKHKKPASLRHLVPITFVLSLIGGTILSAFSNVVKYLFSIELLLYFLCAFIFAVKASKEKPKHILKIFISFIILHVGYGIGFLQGLVVFYILKSKKSIDKNAKMSR